VHLKRYCALNLLMQPGYGLLESSFKLHDDLVISVLCALSAYFRGLQSSFVQALKSGISFGNVLLTASRAVVCSLSTISAASRAVLCGVMCATLARLHLSRFRLPSSSSYIEALFISMRVCGREGSRDLYSQDCTK
jgi:hypothetical protein